MHQRRLRTPNGHIPESYLPLAHEVLNTIKTYEEFKTRAIPWIQSSQDKSRFEEETAKTMLEVNLALKEFGGFVIYHISNNRFNFLGVDEWLGNDPTNPERHLWHVAGAAPNIVVPMHKTEAIEELRQSLQQPRFAA